MNVISLYDITFIYFYTGLDTADNILFRTNYNQDTLDNHITIDPNEYRRQLEEMSMNCFIVLVLEDNYYR